MQNNPQSGRGAWLQAQFHFPPSLFCFFMQGFYSKESCWGARLHRFCYILHTKRSSLGLLSAYLQLRARRCKTYPNQRNWHPLSMLKGEKRSERVTGLNSSSQSNTLHPPPPHTHKRITTLCIPRLPSAKGPASDWRCRSTLPFSGLWSVSRWQKVITF